jgi:hypothetical protein
MATISKSQKHAAKEEQQRRKPSQPSTSQTSLNSIAQRALAQPTALSAPNILQLQKTVGNQSTNRLLAQRASRHVQRRIESKAATPPSEPGTAFEQQLSRVGEGMPLPSHTQNFMEQRIGADFGDVRLHNGSDAVQLNREVGARAFTLGKDIYFGEGDHNLNSSDGQKLLAHELTHTVQQGASPVQRQATAEPGFLTSTTPTIQRTIGGGQYRRTINSITKQLARPLTKAETDLVDQMWGDKTTYSVDDVVGILQKKSARGNTHGPVTILAQSTGAPKPDTKTHIDFSNSSQTNFKGERAKALFKTFVELNEASAGSKVGYLQTLRFSRRALKINNQMQPSFHMAGVRDGDEKQAPWMVPPQPAYKRPVMIEMKDEPGQWSPEGGDDISAEGVDIFTTWLVSTTENSPGGNEDVQFLYHWDWKIDWSGKSCVITGSGPGQGSNSPVFEGMGARWLYNSFLQHGAATNEKPAYIYDRALKQMTEGVKGPNLDTDVNPAMLKEILSEMKVNWNQLSESKQDYFRDDTLAALEEYMMRVQRRRPAQRYLGEELGFANLTKK